MWYTLKIIVSGSFTQTWHLQRTCLKPRRMQEYGSDTVWGLLFMTFLLTLTTNVEIWSLMWYAVLSVVDRWKKMRPPRKWSPSSATSLSAVLKWSLLLLLSSSSTMFSTQRKQCNTSPNARLRTLVKTSFFSSFCLGLPGVFSCSLGRSRNCISTTLFSLPTVIWSFSDLISLHLPLARVKSRRTRESVAISRVLRGFKKTALLSCVSATSSFNPGVETHWRSTWVYCFCENCMFPLFFLTASIYEYVLIKMMQRREIWHSSYSCS